MNTHQSPLPMAVAIDQNERNFEVSLTPPNKVRLSHPANSSIRVTDENRAALRAGVTNDGVRTVRRLIFRP